MLKSRFYIFLFFYHIIYIVLSYNYALSHRGDSHFYWAETFSISNYSWFTVPNYSTDILLLFNYPFIKLGMPFWVAFLLYGIIGYFGILKFIAWAKLSCGDFFVYKGFDLMYLVFFLPNLHFWTATLGKEPLIFWGIASVLYAVTKQKYISFGFIAGSLLLVLLRPHIAFMLLSAISIVMLFQKNVNSKIKIYLACIFTLVAAGLIYMVFQLTNIRYWDWSRIDYFNKYSVLSFRDSGSYVPMLEYNYFYKLFSLHFRPLFYDAYSLWLIFSSIENILVLLVFIISVCYAVKYYNKIKYSPAIKIVFLFTFIASIIYVQRYANLGIFMRTKVMFQPFMIIAMLTIIKQGMNFKNAQT